MACQTPKIDRFSKVINLRTLMFSISIHVRRRKFYFHRKKKEGYLLLTYPRYSYSIIAPREPKAAEDSPPRLLYSLSA